jgi:hypothetical protein
MCNEFSTISKGSREAAGAAKAIGKATTGLLQAAGETAERIRTTKERERETTERVRRASKEVSQAATTTSKAKSFNSCSCPEASAQLPGIALSQEPNQSQIPRGLEQDQKQKGAAEIRLLKANTSEPFPRRTHHSPEFVCSDAADQRQVIW